ncbi:hypothetical protein DFJ73DRAFT_172765 [Zopfochytrium polystomum]|nr:hypothetical protein DFJ73DRAFT_172765 [Zopfochytrium polystomum]
MPPVLSPRASRAVVLLAVGLAFVWGIVHLHMPSAPFPAIHSRVHILFPSATWAGAPPHASSSASSPPPPPQAPPDSQPEHQPQQQPQQPQQQQQQQGQKSPDALPRPTTPDYSVLLFHGNDNSTLHIASWSKSPAGGVGSGVGGGQTDDASASLSAVNVFDVPFSPYIGAQRSLSAMTPRLQVATAALRSAARVAGKAHLLSVAKHAAPRPVLALQTYVVDEEDVAFFARVLEVAGDVPVSVEGGGGGGDGGCGGDAGSQRCECFRTALPGDPAFWSCTNAVQQHQPPPPPPRDDDDAAESSDPPPGSAAVVAAATEPDRAWTYQLPGSSFVKKFAYTTFGNLLYARQLDEARFRLIRNPSGRAGNVSADNLERKVVFDSSHSIAGPRAGPIGTPLVLIELYGGPTGHVILDIRYDRIDDDTFDFFLRLVHKPSEGEEWVDYFPLKPVC